MYVRVLGAGVAGLTAALALRAAGCGVAIAQPPDAAAGTGCSPQAGGMLAPGCERETAEPLIARLGWRSMALWPRFGVNYSQTGSLVVAHGRDRPDLDRFARLTDGYERLDKARIAALEPDLGERFRSGLFFPEEGHLDPVGALAALRQACQDRGIAVETRGAAPRDDDVDRVVDCRGLAARDELPDLRGVKGETALIRTEEVQLHRPVRVIHPRFPIYIVPRGHGRYLVGATSLESDEGERVSLRSALELLSAAYSLHPAFGEAAIETLSTGVRPAFPDNLPRIVDTGHKLYVNGLYRHGWLIAPAMAECLAEYLVAGTLDQEVIHAGGDQRRGAQRDQHNPGGLAERAGL